jgi:hypothetical protein
VPSLAATFYHSQLAGQSIDACFFLPIAEIRNMTWCWPCSCPSLAASKVLPGFLLEASVRADPYHHSLMSLSNVDHVSLDGKFLQDALSRQVFSYIMCYFGIHVYLCFHLAQNNWLLLIPRLSPSILERMEFSVFRSVYSQTISHLPSYTMFQINNIISEHGRLMNSLQECDFKNVILLCDSVE